MAIQSSIGAVLYAKIFIRNKIAQVNISERIFMDQEQFEKAIAEYYTKVVNEENPHIVSFLRTGLKYKRKTYIKDENGFRRTTASALNKAEE